MLQSSLSPESLTMLLKVGRVLLLFFGLGFLAAALRASFLHVNSDGRDKMVESSRALGAWGVGGLLIVLILFFVLTALFLRIR